jgi:peptidoglycan/LPS O-acetylase OafA/YrhL
VWWNVDGYNLEHHLMKPGSALNFFVCVAISLALSTLLYKGIEIPYRKTPMGAAPSTVRPNSSFP